MTVIRGDPRGRGDRKVRWQWLLAAHRAAHRNGDTHPKHRPCAKHRIPPNTTARAFPCRHAQRMGRRPELQNNDDASGSIGRVDDSTLLAIERPHPRLLVYYAAVPLLPVHHDAVPLRRRGRRFSLFEDARRAIEDGVGLAGRRSECGPRLGTRRCERGAPAGRSPGTVVVLSASPRYLAYRLFKMWVGLVVAYAVEHTLLHSALKGPRRSA